MRVWHGIEEIDTSGSVVTIGNFDGVHRGHRAVLEATIARARSLGLPAVALTFDPHPAQVHRPGTTAPLLTGLTDRLALLAEVGIDATLVVRYTLEFADQSPEDFVTTYLLEALRARAVVVAPNLDDTAVLVTLSVREIAPRAMIVASVRESENQHLLEQSGADSVVISSETAGRMLGLATVTPSVVEMMEDLLSPDEGFSVAERPVAEDEVGSNPRHLADIVLGVVRSGELYRIDSPEAETVEPGDRLLYVRRVFSDDVKD